MLLKYIYEELWKGREEGNNLLLDTFLVKKKIFNVVITGCFFFTIAVHNPFPPLLLG